MPLFHKGSMMEFNLTFSFLTIVLSAEILVQRKLWHNLQLLQPITKQLEQAQSFISDEKSQT